MAHCNVCDVDFDENDAGQVSMHQHEAEAGEAQETVSASEETTE